MHKEISIANIWLSIGITKQIALGFVISKYFISLDIGPFYLVMEF
jgi:hypothetical protein